MESVWRDQIFDRINWKPVNPESSQPRPPVEDPTPNCQVYEKPNWATNQSLNLVELGTIHHPSVESVGIWTSLQNCDQWVPNFNSQFCLTVINVQLGAKLQWSVCNWPVCTLVWNPSFKELELHATCWGEHQFSPLWRSNAKHRTFGGWSNVPFLKSY